MVRFFYKINIQGVNGDRHKLKHSLIFLDLPKYRHSGCNISAFQKNKQYLKSDLKGLCSAKDKRNFNSFLLKNSAYTQRQNIIILVVSLLELSTN